MHCHPEPQIVIVAMADDPTRESLVCVALEQAGYLPVAVENAEEARSLTRVTPVEPIAIVSAPDSVGAAGLSPRTPLVPCRDLEVPAAGTPLDTRAVPDLLAVLDEVSRADQRRPRR